MKNIYEFWLKYLIPLFNDIIKEKIFIPIIIIICIAFKNKMLILIKYVISRIEKNLWKFLNKRKVFLFGRTNIEDDIYSHHKKGRHNKCILICGNGGTGKTTIAKYMEAYPKLGARILVVDNGDIPSSDKVKNNTIVFFDYIYENKDDIIKLYNDLKKNSHITFILLEREFNSDNLREEIKITKEIDLNERTNRLNKEDMKNVIYHNITYDYDKIKKCYRKNTEPFNMEKAEKYSEVIESRFDSKYFRPIFAVIISKLYKTEKNFQIDNFNNVDELYCQYWNMILGKEKHERAFKKFLASEKVIIENLVNDVKLIIIFVALSGLRISFEFLQNKVHNITLYEGDSVFGSELLLKYITDRMKYLTKLNFAFFLQENVKEYNGKYFIEKHDYDLSIAWLFKHCLEDSKLKIHVLDLISSINNTENARFVLTNMYSCLSRIGDENKEYFDFITTLLKDVEVNNKNLYDKIDIHITNICNCKEFQKQFYLEQFETQWKIIEGEDLEVRNACEKFALDIIDKQRISCDYIDEIKKVIQNGNRFIIKTR